MALVGADAFRLLRAKQSGVEFARTLTVGRLNLYLHPSEVGALRQEVPGTAGPVLESYRFGDFAEPFLVGVLGAGTVTAMDHSAYEGASVVHDLNQPLPEALAGQFDAVIEAGTLEHVFNVPVALASLMRAVRLGGAVFLTVPANNLCGHGFYQFSPELMFRVFSPDNGFTLERLELLQASFPAVESTPISAIYAVADPATLGERIGLRSTRPVMMAVHATRISERPPFANSPQQSDYVAKWSAGHASGSSFLRTALGRLPLFAQSRVIGYYHLWKYSYRNRRAYTRVRRP